jgi:hypothetical protein
MFSFKNNQFSKEPSHLIFEKPKPNKFIGSQNKIKPRTKGSLILNFSKN